MTEIALGSQAQFGALVEEARAEIHDLITSLETQIESMYKEAHVLGELQGKEEAQVNSFDIESKKASLISHLIANIKPLALKVAHELLSSESAMFSETIARVALKAAPFASEATQICFRVHPEDEETLKAKKSLIAASLEKTGEFEIKPDMNIERGGLVIQTEFGIIDAQIKTQIEEISQIQLLEANL